ncbi:hypothetical protein ABW20_dc0108179 [Dactylellina cionopaga]|nr:hypothetical protein ABW20_dc0108179 [Dactylellina cionopaga]
MTNQPTDLKLPSGELVDELESFRRRWEEDLKKQPTTSSQPNATASASASKPVPSADSGASRTEIPAQKRRQSQTTRDGYRPTAHALREQGQYEDGFRSLDLDAKLSLSLGPGERTLTSTPLTTALEHYEAGVEKEEEGKINESLRLYRKAFKLDPAVYQQYKDKHFPQKPTTGKGKNVADIAEKRPEEPVLLSTEELINTFSSIPIITGTEINLAALKGKESYKKAPSCPISTAPREILIQIFARLAETDLASFARSVTVCKAFCYLVYTERQIWKHLCDEAYENMIWGPPWACDIKGKKLPQQLESGEDDLHNYGSLTSNLGGLSITENEFEDESEIEAGKFDALVTRPYDEIEILKYNSSYRTMFIERPRIRYNGVYISTCTYLRSGHANVVLTNPVLLVTYYRYLRFFPSGFVLTLLTPAEPADVVHSITLENYNHLSSSTSTSTHGTIAPLSTLNNIKHILPGRWRIIFNPITYPSPNTLEEPGSKIQIETEGSGANSRYINTLDLTLKMRPKGVGGKRGYGDRLSWNSYTSWNRLTDDRGVYSLKNDKPFYFSRVKAYERENQGAAETAE